MVMGAGISLWRYLAQSQVDSQTHAERRVIHSFIFSFIHSFLFPAFLGGGGFNQPQDKTRTLHRSSHIDVLNSPHHLILIITSSSSVSTQAVGGSCDVRSRGTFSELGRARSEQPSHLRSRRNIRAVVAACRNSNKAAGHSRTAAQLKRQLHPPGHPPERLNGSGHASWIGKRQPVSFVEFDQVGFASQSTGLDLQRLCSLLTER